MENPAAAIPAQLFAKGKRGLTFLRELDGKTVLVKRRNPSSAVDTIANEARFTRALNAKGIGPDFISYDAKGGELVREYIEGAELRKWMPCADVVSLRKALLSLLRQCKTMDGLKIDKQEMTRPWKNVIVRPSGEPVLIDFERCREVTVPKNVTQFCQFLTSTALTAQLRKQDIVINNTKLLELSKKYKQNLRESNTRGAEVTYLEIERLLRDA
jgi:putative serine/threonine protein kinase